MNRGDVWSKFLDSLTYEPYPFQEEALLAWFETDDGVLVSAPTGMGKTLIAESAIYEALVTGRRLYYTTPLIALTDQKFREFQDRAEAWGFSRDDVGLITGNRRVNPDARVRVVVAEILLNHLIGGQERFDDVSAVVMDEFHYFNDQDRGVVWELSLVLLPKSVRLMLLSATVGNAVDFTRWLREEHGRALRLVRTDERKVPLEYVWVGDKLLNEHLPSMLSRDDEESRSPALVFCFNRDECWEVAEQIKGVDLIDAANRKEIESSIDRAVFSDGVGPKLWNMLIRGVGVHHAGVLPKYKEVIENLFLRKLIPFVICTETLAAGINLPARSVVLSTLLKGKPREKKLIPPSSAHQIFGRAGRPQFDKRGFVFALAHEDDARIAKWRKKYDLIDPKSKDPGLLRARKELERKKPSRRKTEQYWTDGQFQTLIKAGPADLLSRTMLPYQVLIFLLTKTHSVREVRSFITKRFNTAERLAKFQEQLAFMLANLQAFGFLTHDPESDAVTLNDSIHKLVNFRSVDPLYGAFLGGELVYSNFEEKLQALESVLDMPPQVCRAARVPDYIEPGPLQKSRLEPMLIALGITVAVTQRPEREDGIRTLEDQWAEEEEQRPPTFPEMLKLLFDSRLTSPEEVRVQPKWILGGVVEHENDFYKFVRARDLQKNEGLVLRHLLRLVILAGEMFGMTEDPDYQTLAAKATDACRQVDPTYTERFLASAEESKKLIEW
jgi:superfamily II DNA/RNA helicase